jgi:hypothetical protein
MISLRTGILPPTSSSTFLAGRISRIQRLLSSIPRSPIHLIVSLYTCSPLLQSLLHFHISLGLVQRGHLRSFYLSSSPLLRVLCVIVSPRLAPSQASWFVFTPSLLDNGFLCHFCSPLAKWSLISVPQSSFRLIALTSAPFMYITGVNASLLIVASRICVHQFYDYQLHCRLHTHDLDAV